MARLGGEEWCIEGLVGKTQGKSRLVILGHRWIDDIKIYLQEVGWRAWTELI